MDRQTQRRGEEGWRLTSFKLVFLFASALLVLTVVGFVNARGSSRTAAVDHSRSCAGIIASARSGFRYSRQALQLSASVSQLLGEVAVASWTQDAARLNRLNSEIAAKQARLKAISARLASLEQRFSRDAPYCRR